MQNREYSYNFSGICSTMESNFEICKPNTHNISAICTKWYSGENEVTDDEKNV